MGILNSSKKRTKKVDLTTLIPQMELFSFVFWKNLKTTKGHFEINWPLLFLYIFRFPFFQISGYANRDSVRESWISTGSSADHAHHVLHHSYHHHRNGIYQNGQCYHQNCLAFLRQNMWQKEFPWKNWFFQRRGDHYLLK